MTRSISGQFIVYAHRKFRTLAHLASVAADTNFVRLEPALLAVSAERIKESLWHQLEIKPGTPWRGQIYLVVHPARSLDEKVNIISKRLAGGWDYRVELPDVLARTRFTRALTGVLLLELANRGAQSHSAEIPAWLADGFAHGNARRRFVGICLVRPRQDGERSAGHPDQRRRNMDWIRWPAPNGCCKIIRR